MTPIDPWTALGLLSLRCGEASSVAIIEAAVGHSDRSSGVLGLSFLVPTMFDEPSKQGRMNLLLAISDSPT